MPYLSIVIPAYNEANRLPETLALVKEYLSRQSYDYEVLVVDDGSADNTVSIATEFAQQFPQLRIIANKENKGKGGVVRQGMLEAKGDYRLFMDADHSTPVTELKKLLKETPKYQVVIGSRYLHPDSIKVRQPFKRRIISRTCNFFIQSLVLAGIKDTQCGFKLFSAEATERIFPRAELSGWSFDIEILALAKYQGYEIKEVAVDWFDAKLSNLRARSGAIPFLRDLVTIVGKARRGEYQ